MFRFATVLIFVTTLAFGGGYAFAAPSVDPLYASSSSPLDQAGDSNRPAENDLGASQHGCHQISCSTHLSTTGVALVHTSGQSRRFSAGERDWRSLMIERDPPVPRAAI